MDSSISVKKSFHLFSHRDNPVDTNSYRMFALFNISKKKWQSEKYSHEENHHFE